MEEKIIIEEALSALKSQTGLDIKEINLSVKQADRLSDGKVELTANGKTYLFEIEAKRELRGHHLKEILKEQYKNQRERWLLICQYVSKPNRETLKEQGINFLDISGNCFIKRDSLFLFINDRPIMSRRKSEEGKIWSASGIRLVFALLNNYKIKDESYRIIAAESNISLGTVGPILRELQQGGYITANNSDSNFQRTKGFLLRHWIDAYYSVLRPKLKRGKFRFSTQADRENWKNRKLHQAWWGGESAGALLTKHLHPQKFTLYSDLPKAEIIKQLHVVPDENGELELLKPFWNTEKRDWKTIQYVPPLLAYAELNASLDSRNREIAERINEKYEFEKK